MVTAIVILSLILGVVVVVSIVLGVALFRKVQERDNAIEHLDTYRRRWEPMTRYLSRCYHNGYYVTHLGPFPSCFVQSTGTPCLLPTSKCFQATVSPSPNGQIVMTRSTIFSEAFIRSSLKAKPDEHVSTPEPFCCRSQTSYRSLRLSHPRCQARSPHRTHALGNVIAQIIKQVGTLNERKTQPFG
jgi:hypothetical protein